MVPMFMWGLVRENCSAYPLLASEKVSSRVWKGRERDFTNLSLTAKRKGFDAPMRQREKLEEQSVQCVAGGAE